MSLSPGTRLGSYKITAAIGAGGMGEVYRARDTRLDRASRSSGCRRRSPVRPGCAIAVRARSARYCGAEPSAHLHALRRRPATSRPTIWSWSWSRARRWRAGSNAARLPLDQALAIGEQIARALDRAHRRGIVHRDLKPCERHDRARRCSATPQVKLLDFGLARLRGRRRRQLHADRGHDRAAAAPLTGAGAILGTLNYMSPEQVEGKEADHRADIFALGCVLYEMADRPARVQRRVAGEHDGGDPRAAAGTARRAPRRSRPRGSIS